MQRKRKRSRSTFQNTHKKTLPFVVIRHLHDHRNFMKKVGRNDKKNDIL